MLKKACGTARFTYNWALAKWTDLYKQGQKPTANELKKLWNKEKPKWVYESPKDANQQPFVNLNNAFQRFFKKLSKYPTFKKKGKKDSFYVSNDRFVFGNKQIKIQKIGRIKVSENLRLKGKIISGTICCRASQWFVSVRVDVDNYSKERSGESVIGVDLGINEAITTSDGLQIKPPRPFKQQKKKIAKLYRRLSRKQKGSNNSKKQIIKLQRAHLKLSNIRQDFWHKITSKLCNENQIMCIEDLNVKGMLKNRSLSFTLADVGLGEFYRQLDYKKDIWNNEVYKVGRFFPSSQLCSNCGNKQKMPLSERVYVCDQCSVSIDRDINAAKNILTEGYSGNYACGQLASG